MIIVNNCTTILYCKVTQMALAITRAIIVKQSVLMAVVIAMLIFVGVIVSTQSEEGKQITKGIIFH